MPVLAQSILVLVAAYLLGSISGYRVLGRIRGVDFGAQGSGTAGGIDALRTQGLVFAIGVLVIDVGKGAMAAWIGRQFAPFDGAADATLGYSAVFAAMLGHVWPAWHRFRGGKGAATLLGGLLVMWPWALPLLVLVAATTVLATGYVALATVLAAMSLPLLAWATDASPSRLVFVSVAALLLLFTHRHHLLRMRGGGEARFERARLLHRLRRGAQ